MAQSYPIGVLISKPGQGLVEFLSAHLDGAHFRLLVVLETARLVEVLVREQPPIVILDRVHERQREARAELAVVRQYIPRARVIALSQESSDHDGQIVEQGVFYYLAAPPGPELVRIIKAAERSLQENPPRALS